MMQRMNIKHYILTNFIQFNKQILLFIAVENEIQKQPFTDVLRNFAVITGKHLRWNSFIKKSLQHRCFPVNIAKFLRTDFL